MTPKDFLRRWTPPALVDALRGARQQRLVPEWEYVPEGWDYARAHPEVRGWNVESVLEAYNQQWPAYMLSVTQTGPLGSLPERVDVSLDGHNAAMSLGYVLALAQCGRQKLHMFDWGGGIGHTYLLAKSLLPETELHYTCCDVPLLAEHGAQLFPDQTFQSDPSWQDSSFDLVMASTALHYAEEWAQLVAKLAASTRRYLYIAKLPTVAKNPSFVFVQRPYQYGYETEYLGWCLNRDELLAVAAGSGLSLVREFIYGYRPPIRNAPEQNEYRGFLFRPATGSERD